MGVDFYEINPAKCTECVGHFDTPQCKEVCRVDCIPLDLDHAKTREELHLKFGWLTAAKVAAITKVAA